MRRFSQRSHLVTLSEINITPLLDLAFVLLIIFVITTPLLEQGREIKLPKGGSPDRTIRNEDKRTVEIAQGFYSMHGRRMTFAQIEAELRRDIQINPNLIVLLRADKTTPWELVFQLQDLCATVGIPINLRSEPKARP
ncbi:MAG: biopolymer transporter ExbD [Verrucomicrobiae bacterium]|nr:biopolymer transporter ExbD [Verrucomicrobiae bacterium]